MVALVIVAVPLGGCLPTRKNDFDIAARNVSKERLDEVRLEFGGFSESFGVLIPNANAQFSGYVGAFPTRAKLTWRLPGRAYMPDITVVIPVPQERPALERGKAQRYELRFELDGKTATAKYIINDYTWMRELEKTENWPAVKPDQ